jgi:hypothetical protein
MLSGACEIQSKPNATRTYLIGEVVQDTNVILLR